jgi:hypothetical protein
MGSFHFKLVDHGEVISSTGHPVDDRDQAIAVAKRLAIDLAQTKQEYLGKGFAVSVVDDREAEIHRESIDKRLTLADCGHLGLCLQPSKRFGVFRTVQS